MYERKRREYERQTEKVNSTKTLRGNVTEDSLMNQLVQLISNLVLQKVSEIECSTGNYA